MPRMNITNCCSALLVMLTTVLCRAVPACEDQHIVLNDENPSYIMSSPNFPDKYPNSVRCEFQYEALAGYIIKLHFSTFELESPSNDACIYDSVKIFDGMHESSPNPWTFCGKEIPPDITSSGSHLLVVFNSDKQYNTVGFEAYVETVQFDPREPLPTIPAGFGGGVLRQAGGAILSPGFPNSYTYSNFPSCIFIIAIPNQNQHVSMRFVIFELSSSEPIECSKTKDYIEIRDGLNSTSPLLDTFCSGNQPSDAVIRSTGSVMYINAYIKENSIGGRFLAEYESTEMSTDEEDKDDSEEDDNDNISICDFSYAPMANRGGVVVSQQAYPEGTYKAGLNCVMEFVAPEPRDRIFLYVKKLDVPHRFTCDGGDFLSIDDGNSTIPNNLATLCRETIRAKYTTFSYYAKVTFVTDYKINEIYNGFELIYSTFYQASSKGCDTNDFECLNDRCIDESLVCDGNDHCGDGSDEYDTECEETNFLPGLIATAIVSSCAVIIVCCCVCHHEKEQKRMGIQPVLRSPNDDVDDDEGVTTMEYVDSLPATPGSTTNLPRGDPVNAISGTLTTSATFVAVDLDTQKAAYASANTPSTSWQADERPKLQQLNPMFLASGVGFSPEMEPQNEPYKYTNDNYDGAYDPVHRTTSPIAWPEQSRAMEQEPRHRFDVNAQPTSNKKHVIDDRPMRKQVLWTEPGEDKSDLGLPPLFPVNNSKTSNILPPVDNDLPPLGGRTNGAYDGEEPPQMTESDEEREKRRQRRKERHRERKEKGEKKKKRSGKDKEKRKEKKKKEKRRKEEEEEEEEEATRAEEQNVQNVLTLS